MNTSNKENEMTHLTIKTYQHNSKSIQTAENETFFWSKDIECDSLMHKATGRYIYQCKWVVDGLMAEKIDDATKAEWKEFWGALETEQERVRNQTVEPTIKAMPENTSWYHTNPDGERELNEDY